MQSSSMWLAEIDAVIYRCGWLKMRQPISFQDKKITAPVDASGKSQLSGRKSLEHPPALPFNASRVGRRKPDIWHRSQNLLLSDT